MLKSDCDYELIWKWGFVLGVDSSLFCFSFFGLVKLENFANLELSFSLVWCFLPVQSLLKDLSLITDSAEKKYKNGTIDMKILNN